jgi:hypothetical protein
MARLAIAGLLLMALGALVPARAFAGDVASAGSPARISVSVPSTARGAGVAMLELGIASNHRAAGGHLGAVVRLQRGGRSVELGRISVVTAGARRAQRYQFNVAPALRRLELTGGSADIEIELIDRGGGGPLASGATLKAGPARIVTR